MYNWFTISLILCWGATMYLFYTAIYSKIKLHNIRMKMQEQGTIEANTNINLLTLKSVIFWMLPIRKYLNQDNERHNQLAKKVNTSLLGMLVMVVVFCLLMTVFR